MTLKRLAGRTEESAGCARCGGQFYGPGPLTIEGAEESFCQSCFDQMLVSWQRVTERQTDARLMRMYGITLDDYGRLYLAQHGVCAICRDRGTPTDESRRTLAVDHSHRNGRVRGLLCSACNTALGLLRDDPLIAQAAADYLHKHRPLTGPEHAARRVAEREARQAAV